MRPTVFTAVLMALFAGSAHAQSQAGCDTTYRAVGGAMGRSSPYFEPSLGISTRSDSVQSGGGLHFAGRAEQPLAGAWRARVEGGLTNWRLERQIYSADLREVIVGEDLGHIDVGQIVALVGRNAGHAPVCAFVLAGGGLYSIDDQHKRSWNSGFALTAGVEFPAGGRGAVQVEMQLHMINTGSRYPIGSSTVLDGRLTAGWMFRLSPRR